MNGGFSVILNIKYETVLGGGDTDAPVGCCRYSHSVQLKRTCGVFPMWMYLYFIIRRRLPMNSPDFICFLRSAFQTCPHCMCLEIFSHKCPGSIWSRCDCTMKIASRWWIMTKTEKKRKFKCFTWQNNKIESKNDLDGMVLHGMCMIMSFYAVALHTKKWLHLRWVHILMSVKQ